jgi:hypothetical protein
MKKIFSVAIAAGLITIAALGQNLKESQVPAAVKTACEKKYPGLEGSRDKEDANYEVNFRQEGKCMSALIENNGTIVEIETGIFVNDLPESVGKYTEKHYAGIKIKEAARVVKANGNTNYGAETNHKDVVFDTNGKFIKELKD